MTPLHWAVEANNFDICLILLKAGANPDVINKVMYCLFVLLNNFLFHVSKKTVHCVHCLTIDQYLYYLILKNSFILN